MIAGLLWRVAPYAALVVAGLVIWGMWGRLEAAQVKLAAAEEVIRVREDDAKRSALAVAQLAETLSKTETKVVTQIERIYAAPITRQCVESPSMRAASGVLHELFPAGGQADPGRQPAPALR